jgi:hypothetical protein
MLTLIVCTFFKSIITHLNPKIMKVNGYAATEQNAKLTPYSYELNDIGPEEVDIKV